MRNQISGKTNKASRIAASTFGVLAGLGGMWHGIGEIRQGNTATGGIVINSWAEGPIAATMGGEPGMTIIPNFLITGILCIAVSLAVIIWSAMFVQHRRGGTVLIGLSVAMMLLGGGFGPPLIGILAGVAGTRINSPLTWWRNRISTGVRRFLAVSWPWVFSIGVASGTLLVIGSVILVYFFNVNNADFFTNNFYFTVIVLIMIILTGAARDTRLKRPVNR